MAKQPVYRKGDKVKFDPLKELGDGSKASAKHAIEATVVKVHPHGVTIKRADGVMDFAHHEQLA